MKISTKCLTLIYLCSIASAERMVRILFNNGIAPPEQDHCNSKKDALQLDQLFNTTDRRNLRMLNVINDESASINEVPVHTDRQLYPIYCKDYCRGYVKGTCRATKCKGFRRKLAVYPIGNPYNVTCPERIRSLNTTLNTLIETKAVSPSCQRILEKPRIFECYDDIVYGEIESINVLDLKNNIINTLNQRLTICKTSILRVEVKVNQCVDTLRVKIQGPVGKPISLPYNQFPFSLIWSLLPGFPFSVLGKYSLQYIPDGIESKSKTLLLDQKKC